MVILAVVVYLLLKIFILEPNALEVRDYWIEDSRLDGIKVAFLTDFNLKKNGGYNRLKKIVKMTDAQDPDVVLLGGDFVYNHDLSKSYDIGKFAYSIKNIGLKKYRNGVPTIAVLGDDDWQSNKSLTIADKLKENGIVVLGNNAVKLGVKGRTVYIAGVKDKKADQPNITKALFKTGHPRILLSHSPDIYYDVMEDVSIILAGHTHGGQVIIPSLPALFVPSQFGSKFASGLIRETNNKMIISRGIGTNKFPGRLNCKPEIVMVNFCRRGACKENPKK